MGVLIWRRDAPYIAAFKREVKYLKNAHDKG